MEDPAHQKCDIPVDNETRNSMTRMTQDGRKIRYDLTVLQQPEKARACGAGAKSSADRRPVDPPPIVQLKIFQIRHDEGEEDITASMNANYFLFATLENARQISNARGMAEKGPTVLTGTPVAGMVYLDRPSPAGYFIFPDLSVRHDGRFRLSFSLYEEVKRVEDGDVKPDVARPASPNDSHVTHRLEVRSCPLTVYTAKTFPGLSESTALSRTVAEQGCRVRIRRDIRMRKQNTKTEPNNWDSYADDTAEARARTSRTPDAYGYPPVAYGDPIPRRRSDSNASHQSIPATIPRKPSLQEMTMSQQPHYGGTAPHTPQSGFAPAQPWGPSPPMPQHSQPEYMQHQQQPMQPPPPQYQPHAYNAQPLTQAPLSQPPNYYGYQVHQQAQPQRQYSTSSYDSNGHAHRMSSDWSAGSVQSDFSRSGSLQISGPHSHMPPLYQPQTYSQHHAAPQHHHGYGSLDSHAWRPPPPETLQPPARATAPTPPLTAKPSFSSMPTNTLPPLTVTTLPRPHAHNPSPSTPLSAINQNSIPPSSFAYHTPHSSESHNKRSYGSTFSTAAYDQPQKGGARPSTEGFGEDMLIPSGEEDDREGTVVAETGSGEHHSKRGFGYENMYKRADGTYHSLTG
ncbi:velum formation-related protein [Oleoguttula sp. CCFEE 5521]